MQKKLLAVAVAGVLAAPAVALAQSSVTISGNFKVSMENVRIGSRVAAGLNNTANRMADDSSRIVFNVTEDLGGGLAAIGQLDIRFKYDDNGTASVANVGGQIGSGNTWVGLRSKSWGQLIFGRQDLHYFNTESDITTKAVSLRQDPISVIAYVQGTAIATASRTQNVTRWLSPNWGGFTMLAAYSTNGAGNDNDLGSTIRRGQAWNLNPNFQAQNFQVGYSYWNQKSDATAPGAFVGSAFIGVPTAAPGGGFAGTDQRGDRLYGSFKWAGFKVGLAWDRSTIQTVTAAGSFESAHRTAWSIPVGWSTGNHNIYAHYTKARNDQSNAATAGTISSINVAGVCGPATGLGNCNTGAKMFALAYVYDMSKRTSVGVSYSKITNDNGAFYNHFTSTSLGDQGSAIHAGEDPRILAATIRHAF